MFSKLTVSNILTKLYENCYKYIKTYTNLICLVSIFVVMKSDSDSDCKITDFKEGKDFIIVTDIPSPKRWKLKPEENLRCKLIHGNGHCVANCFVLHFKKKP